MSDTPQCVLELSSNSDAITRAPNADENEAITVAESVPRDIGGAAGNEVEESKSASPDATSLQASSVALDSSPAQEHAAAHSSLKAAAGAGGLEVERASVEVRKARVGMRWRLLVFLARLSEPSLVRQLRDHRAHRRRPCRARSDCSCEICKAAASCPLCPKWRKPSATTMENTENAETQTYALNAEASRHLRRRPGGCPTRSSARSGV